jgi:hypothetical protein
MGKMKKNKEDYPQKKKRDLTEVEKKEIRKDIEKGEDDIYELAKQFSCSTSQVAGVKAYLKRSGKKNDKKGNFIQANLHF